MSTNSKVQTARAKKLTTATSVDVPLQKKAVGKATPASSQRLTTAPKPAAKKQSKMAPSSPAKAPQAKKAKLVRDSFTMPENEHSLIKQCKKAAISQGRETKKSEVVRAALQVFHALPLNAQLAAYSKLSVLAVRRPKSK